MSIQKVNIPDDSMISIIRNHVKVGKGLSLTRIGDGEIHILNNRLSPSLEKLFTTTFKYKNPTEGLKDSRKVLMSVLKNSDYIGIMGDNKISQLLNKSWRWDFDNIFIKESKRVKENNLFDCMLVRGPNLGSPKGFKKIIKKEPICIITPIVNELRKNNLEKHLDTKISYIKVPWGGDLKNRDHIFKELDKIEERIVIISNGLYGKDFPYYLSKKGKVCIDMGATLDGWAGKITRPWFKPGKLQSHCLIK